MQWWNQTWFLEWEKNARRDYHGVVSGEALSYNDIENQLRNKMESKKPKWPLPLETGWLH